MNTQNYITKPFLYLVIICMGFTFVSLIGSIISSIVGKPVGNESSTILLLVLVALIAIGHLEWHMEQDEKIKNKKVS